MDWLASRLLRWFDRHGRKHLPWQQNPDPYRVWVSEIMLQQTQVTTVIPFFERFVARFGDVAALAAADLDEVLHYWTGLGYYARGRNLHKAARQIVERHGGALPDDLDALTALPGVGRSTAGAVLAIAYGRRAAILDGNVKRVLARFHAVEGYPGDAAPLKALWRHAERHTPARRARDYTQAIMDLGATLCTRTRPRCADCPLAERCVALDRQAVERLPQRKARRDKPLRSARMFLVVDPEGRCLLERRPPHGVWGGLWTPPERAADTSVAELCEQYRIAPERVIGCRPGPTFRHTFSHFHLDIEPVYVDLDALPEGVAEGVAGQVGDGADLCWFSPHTDSGRPALGLSAPAARLLSSLAPSLPPRHA